MDAAVVWQNACHAEFNNATKFDPFRITKAPHQYLLNERWGRRGLSRRDLLAARSADDVAPDQSEAYVEVSVCKRIPMLKRKRYFSLLAFAAATFLSSGFCETARAQDDSTQSVAEAARRARAQKKNAANPVKTVTNDDLPKAPVSAGDAATQTKPDVPATAKPEDGTAAVATTPVNDEKAKQKKLDDKAALERAKKDLAQAAGELDVLQRKAALDSDAYYSKPGYQNDTAGKANLDAEAQQISDKKQVVDTLKARVAELQALVGEDPNAAPSKTAPQN